MFLLMEAKVEQEKKLGAFEKRIHEIDFLRGFLILIVVIDHLFYNLGVYGGKWGIDWMYGFFRMFYWFGAPRKIIQPVALMAFCFLSGVSSSFSRNNWKRALQMVAFWLIIALGGFILTLLIDNNVITFLNGSLRVDLNIIGVLALSTLLYCIVERRSYKALIASILIGFLLCSYFIPALMNGLSNICGVINPDRATSMHYYFANGLEGVPNFYLPLFWEPLNQSDYVPLFPYVLFFFGGALLSYFVYRNKKQSIIKHKGEWERPFCFMGRHSLIIYLSHMFILSGIFMLIDIIV